jgi:hypothetical protein
MTFSPSNTFRCRHFGISSSYCSPFSFGDDQPALALGLLAEADRARELGQDRRILRPARLEQVRDARQTAGDVAGLRALLRHTREHVADEDAGAVLHADHRAGRQRVGRRNLGVREVDGLPLSSTASPSDDTRAALRAWVEHDGAGQAGDLVDLLRDGHIVDEVLELEVGR